MINEDVQNFVKSGFGHYQSLKLTKELYCDLLLIKLNCIKQRLPEDVISLIEKIEDLDEQIFKHLTGV